MIPQLTVLECDGGTMQLTGGESPVFIPSRLFRLEVDGVIHETLEDVDIRSDGQKVEVKGRLKGGSLRVSWTGRELGPGVWEFSLVLTNEDAVKHRVSQMDPLSARLARGDWDSLYFRSSWGEEFTPESSALDDGLHLESRSGRSSHGYSPWLGLEMQNAAVIVAPAWSGNWHIDIDGDRRLSAGISPWAFFTDVAPSEQVSAPSVVIAVSSDREEAAVLLTAAIGDAWIARSAASDAVPVEWNHWWPYEDVEVNEEVIWANAAIAAELGASVSTVDAGWFGASDAQSSWREQRGDWNHINTDRFPSGLAKLGDGIRAAGTKAGIWLEAEAVGSAAELRRTHPEIMAYGAKDWKRDGSYSNHTASLDADDPSFLGYVCLGSPEGREYAARSLDAAIREMDAAWIKLDFNIDPDSGCTRTDHGHGEGDGLFRHYEGLYEVIDEFRASHPEVIFEACASGGLRVDLGLAQHVHCFFLSDPDYTDHHLQVAWGTSLMLPPVALLHFSWSQWRSDFPNVMVDFATLDRHQFDTMLRAAMIHRFGFSLRLPELRAEQLDSLKWHTQLFTQIIAPFVRTGIIRRLTGQPLRRGRGERAPVFQLSTADDRHLIASFRLDSGSVATDVIPKALRDDVDYQVTDLATGSVNKLTSKVTLDRSDGEVSSWLMLVEPVGR